MVVILLNTGQPGRLRSGIQERTRGRDSRLRRDYSWTWEDEDMLSIRGDTQFKGDLKRLLQRGDVWNYFTHDPSRSRAFHWGDRAAQGPYLDLPAWAYHVFELSIAA